jgi:hypothetical protein
MAPKVEFDKLKAVVLVKSSGNPGTNREEQEQQFKHLTQLVKDVYGGYPFNKLDPGFLPEIEHLTQYDATAREEFSIPLNTDKDKKSLARDDVRLVRAQEILRDAYYIAYTPKRGFKGIGRPPELQQLVAATCSGIYVSHALRPAIRGPSRGAELLSKLSPHLRITLLAEVAAGILCTR